MITDDDIERLVADAIRAETDGHLRHVELERWRGERQQKLERLSELAWRSFLAILLLGVTAVVTAQIYIRTNGA